MLLGTNLPHAFVVIIVSGTNLYIFRLTEKCHNVRTLSLTAVYAVDAWHFSCWAVLQRHNVNDLWLLTLGIKGFFLLASISYTRNTKPLVTTHSFLMPTSSIRNFINILL